MVTTVGTSGDLPSLIENFIYLERDAIAAYDETISRLESPTHKTRIAEFREDHLRHLEELKTLAAKHGASVPAEGDMKQMLTTGKIKMADMTGSDGALLKAMSSNETDTVTAYANGASNEAIPPEDRPIFQRAHADEERHKTYMDQASQAGA